MTRKNDMTQEENNPLIPKLRFPEFRNAGGWRTVQLSEVLDYERPDRYIVNDTNYVNDGIPVLTANKSFVIGYTRETENVYTDVPVVIFDDFTTDKKLVTFAFKVKSSAIKILKAKKGDDLRLLYELMAQIKFDAQEHKRYYISEYQYIKIPLPEINEQKKVAECLSTLDELIEAESRKLDALKDHKKGLMQQLFPREGETRPRLRFPEFQNAPEWEEKSISDIGDVVTGSTPNTAKREFYGGDISFVSPADISELRFVETTKTTLTELGFAQTRPIRAGSTVFVCIGSSIGKVAQVRRDSATNQQINSVIPNSDHDDAFVYYALAQNADRVAKLAGVQAVPIVNKSQFSSVSLPVPGRDEQHRIATCLSSIDDLIAAQSERLEALRTHKRGLMQQLFPNPCEFES